MWIFSNFLSVLASPWGLISYINMFWCHCQWAMIQSVLFISLKRAIEQCWNEQNIFMNQSVNVEPQTNVINFYLSLGKYFISSSKTIYCQLYMLYLLKGTLHFQFLIVIYLLVILVWFNRWTVGFEWIF